MIIILVINSIIYLKFSTSELKDDGQMQDLKWNNKLGVPMKFIIFNIWFLCDARLPNAMTYLLETFTWRNKFCTFFGHLCFVGFLQFHQNLSIVIYLIFFFICVGWSKYSYFSSKTYLSSSNYVEHKKWE
jgi:hypothetical protein